MSCLLQIEKKIFSKDESTAEVGTTPRHQLMIQGKLMQRKEQMTTIHTKNSMSKKMKDMS